MGVGGCHLETQSEEIGKARDGDWKGTEQAMSGAGRCAEKCNCISILGQIRTIRIHPGKRQPAICIGPRGVGEIPGILTSMIKRLRDRTVARPEIDRS